MSLFPLCELCHFLTSDSMEVYRQWVSCERNSSYNFIPIFLKLCTCFRHGLEMCMWFGYNRWINFCHFFHFLNFVIFWPQILWKCIDSGYHVSATPYTTSSLSLFNFAHLFVHGLKMCMWFGFNPAVNFCHFSTLLTLSFFAGATSTSPKFDLYFRFINNALNKILPDLLATLEDTSKRITMFLPTDDAFAKLPVDKQMILDSNSTKLTQVPIAD